MNELFLNRDLKKKERERDRTSLLDKKHFDRNGGGFWHIFQHGCFTYLRTRDQILLVISNFY